MRVSFEGDCTIGRAAELRETLLQALAAGEGMELDFQGVAGMDLSFCQLVHALRASCRERGLDCELRPNLPAELADLAQRCGLPELIGPSTAGAADSTAGGAGGKP